MQNRNKGPIQKTAVASQDLEDIRGVRQEGFRIGVREESNRDVQRVAECERLGSVTGFEPSGAKKQGSDIVEKSIPPETEEEPTNVTSNVSVI
jgi:hypothetical protein